MFTLTTRVTGLGELQSEIVRLGPVLVVRDGVGMAFIGHPFASYLCLGVDTERLDQLRGAIGLSRRRFHFLVSLGLA